MMPAQMVLPESVVATRGCWVEIIRLKGAVRPYFLPKGKRRSGWMRKEARPLVLTLFTPGGNHGAQTR